MGFHHGLMHGFSMGLGGGLAHWLFRLSPLLGLALFVFFFLKWRRGR
jgi:hypothetical protein